MKTNRNRCLLRPFSEMSFLAKEVELNQNKTFNQLTFPK